MQISCYSISTTDIQIINHIPIVEKELIIEMTHRIDYSENHSQCVCYTAVRIRRSDEANIEDKTFLISVNLQAHYTIIEFNGNKDDVQSFTINDMFPHIRSQIAMIMSSVGLQPIFITNPLLSQS